MVEAAPKKDYSPLKEVEQRLISNAVQNSLNNPADTFDHLATLDTFPTTPLFRAKAKNTVASALFGFAVTPALQETLPSLITGIPVSLRGMTHNAYVSEIILRRYPSPYHEFLLEGYALLRDAAEKTFKNLTDPNHPHHPFLDAFLIHRKEALKAVAVFEKRVKKKPLRKGAPLHESKTSWLTLTADNAHSHLLVLMSLQRACKTKLADQPLTRDFFFKQVLASNNRLTWMTHLAFVNQIAIMGKPPGIDQERKDEPMPNDPFAGYENHGMIKEDGFYWTDLHDEPLIDGYCPAAVWVDLPSSFKSIFTQAEVYTGQKVSYGRNGKSNLAMITNIPLGIIGARWLSDEKPTAPLSFDS